MAMYFTFELDVLARRNLYLNQIEDTVLIRQIGELTAWGEAPDLAAAVELLDRWKQQATAPEASRLLLRLLALTP